MEQIGWRLYFAAHAGNGLWILIDLYLLFIFILIVVFIYRDFAELCSAGQPGRLFLRWVRLDRRTNASAPTWSLRRLGFGIVGWGVWGYGDC
jgi:hypothetical protein